LLAFNAHFQFEQLRESGQFERMQEVIRDRDTELEGDVNPNLANFGEHTEAKQYSGREVGDDWGCPVTFETPG
jgi:FPC/CPF motif-containing protein YcgG